MLDQMGLGPRVLTLFVLFVTQQSVGMGTEQSAILLHRPLLQLPLRVLALRGGGAETNMLRPTEKTETWDSFLDEEQFPTLDAARYIRVASVSEQDEDVSSEVEEKESPESEKLSNAESGAELSCADEYEEDDDAAGDATIEWDMTEGRGEGLWHEKEYVSLRHRRLGTTVELLRDAAQPTFLFLDQEGGEVRGYLGPTMGVSFVPSLSAPGLSTHLKDIDADKPTQLEGLDSTLVGSWVLETRQYAKQNVQVSIRHSSVQDSELILLPNGFCFLSAALPRALVVENSRVGRIPGEILREMLQDSRPLLHPAPQTEQAYGEAGSKLGDLLSQVCSLPRYVICNVRAVSSADVRWLELTARDV